MLHMKLRLEFVDLRNQNMRVLLIILVQLVLCQGILFCQTEYKVYFYETGKISSEGTLRDGKPDGYWKTYYPAGALKTEGNRKEFKLDSTWKFFRADSTLERLITYKNDVKNGVEKIFDKNGGLKDEFNNVNGIKQGDAFSYYETGELWKKVKFENNKEEGKALEYEKDGRIISYITYKNGFIYAEERINRYNSEGNKTGLWQDLFPNGQIKEEGTWSNGLKNGIFKYFDRRGTLLKMEKYTDGILDKESDETILLDIRDEYHEDGTLKESGSYREGKKHGTFREYDPRGKEIGGALYENDKKIGDGMLDSIGRRIGPWKVYYASGELKAEGEYTNGLKQGPWQYYFQNGKSEQKGSYKDDLPTGQWKWFYVDGAIHRDEMYRKGLEDGHAVEYDSLGKVINEGDYIGGYKTGPWFLTVNDHTELGEYIDGERNGLWLWKYGNDQKAFEGEFQSGIPIGKHKYWYDNGKFKMKGPYEGGELNGTWEYYNEDGTIALEIEYEAGVTVKINGQKIKLPVDSEDN